MKMCGTIALVLMGFLVGMAVANMLICHRVDNIMAIQKSLEMDLEEAQTKLEQLEKSNQESSGPVVKDILVAIEAPERDFNTEDAQRYIKELLREQIGKEIESIDIELIYKVLDKRNAEFGGESYTFKVQSVLLSESLHIKATMRKINKSLPE